MMVFGQGSKAFKVTEIDASDGQGVIVSTPGGDPVGSSSIVTSFSVNQAENYSVSQCLNGGVFLYAFGHDPSKSPFTVEVASFLHTCDSSGFGTDLANAVSVYGKGRVSQSKQQATLSVGSAAFRGYLTSQDVSVINQELGIVGTTYGFVALDAH